MLSASVTSTSDAVLVRIAGSAETSLLDRVSDALRGADEAARPRRRQVVVDLRELAFASSSCLKLFASWLVAVTELGEPYHVKILACARYAWQQRSIPALLALAPAIVTVETIA